MVQVRQGLGERETPLVLCQGAADHDPRDLVRGFGRSAISRRIVSSCSSWWNINSLSDRQGRERRNVAGEHEVCAEVAHVLQRL